MMLKLSKLTFYLFFIILVLPLIYTLSSALFLEKSLVDNLMLINLKTLLLLAKSCFIAFCIAVLSTFFGTCFGFMLFKTKIKYCGFFKMALMIPLFISPYILAVAWKDLFFMVFQNTSFFMSSFGVVVVLTTLFTPLSMLIVGGALSNIDSQMEESGLLITRFRSVVFKIILPLIKPAILCSFVLVFIFSISEFSVAAFFGVKVFTTEIFTQFSAFYNHSLAILQSTLLIIICISLLLSERKYISDAPFLSIGSKGTANRQYDFSKLNSFGLLSLFGWFFITTVLPFMVLSVQSFKDGVTKFLEALHLLSTTFLNSIGLALAGAFFIVLIGFISAYFIAKYKNHKIGKAFDSVLLVVFAIPSTILGVSLIKFYNQPNLDFIYSSFIIILIGYIGKFTFISTKLIGNAIKQMPNSLEESAQLMGVKQFFVLQKIVMPLIMPSLYVSFIISFIFCLGELGTTIMLYPPGTEIMPIKVFTIMANAPQSLTSSMTLIVFSVTLIMIMCFYLLSRVFTKKYRFNND